MSRTKKHIGSVELGRGQIDSPVHEGSSVSSEAWKVEVAAANRALEVLEMNVRRVVRDVACASDENLPPVELARFLQPEGAALKTITKSVLSMALGLAVLRHRGAA